MSKNNKLKVVAVVGPTGSGKTGLSVQIAKKFDGVIISADSRQVYRGLDIGTNKEGLPGEYLGEPARYIDDIPQLLIDIADPGTRLSLYDWLLAARRAVKLVAKQGKLPIISGGTGLYVSALLSNWQLSGANPTVRRELEKKTLNELQEIANQLAQKLNSSDYRNPRRLVRLIEKSTSDNEPVLPSLELNHLIISNEVSREELFERSDKRFLRIFDNLVDEARPFDPVWLSSLGLDYRIAAKRILEETPKEELLAEYNIEAHRYIRRQQTWWEHHEEVVSVKDEGKAVGLVEKFLRTDRKLVE